MKGLAGKINGNHFQGGEYFVLLTYWIVFTSPENAALFSQLIARTAQDVDILIDSLPNQEYTPEKQVG